MPELPEVEAARKALHESCCGLTILEAIVADDPLVIDGVSPSDLQTALTSRKILNVLRKGKNLWLELDQRPWPTFQFGMTGAFYIKGKEITKYKRSAVSDKEEWPSKFSKVFLKLDNELEVSFTDKRRLARIRLINDPSTTPPISELGPDAYLELPDGTTFTSSVLKKKCPIKALLLDQSFLAGIGNWLADEVLYQARIHPEQTASSLSEDECIELHKCIQKVIRLSVEVDADSERFPPNWIFHYRWNKKPGEVDGKKVEFITVGGRTSAYVPALQKCTSETSKRKNGVGRKNPEAEHTSVKVKRSSKRNQDEEAPAPEQAGDSKKTKRNKGSTSRETVVVSESELEKVGKGKTEKVGKGKTRKIEGKEETKVNKSTATVSNAKKNVEKEKKKEKTAGKKQVKEQTEQLLKISNDEASNESHETSTKLKKRSGRSGSKTIGSSELPASTNKSSQGQKRKRGSK